MKASFFARCCLRTTTRQRLTKYCTVIIKILYGNHLIENNENSMDINPMSSNKPAMESWRHGVQHPPWLIPVVSHTTEETTENPS